MKSHTVRSAAIRVGFFFAALIGLAFAPRSASAQSTATYTVMSSMPATNAKPYGPLLLSGGKLYGTTTLPTDGTYFDISETGSSITSLHALSLTQGESPYSPLVMDASGNLYGTAPLGGSTSTGGAVYKTASPYTGTPTKLYGFGAAGSTQNGTQPYAPVLLGFNGTSFDGFLYGVCSNAGSGFGTIFKLASASAGTPTVIHTFIGGTTDGATPYGGMVEDSNGILYGVTETGGAFSAGTVFSISTAGANYTVIHSFGGPGDAAKNPWSGMVLSNGTLYGMTVGGGTAGFGAVYSLSKSGSGYTVLHSFNGTTDGGMSSAAGFNPYNQGLVLGVDGNLYGTTNNLGSGAGTTTTTTGTYAGGGTVFGLTTSGTNFTTLYAFPASGGSNSATVGAVPGGGLVQDSVSGLFFGTTTVGGNANDGVVYSITPGLATTTAVPVVNSGTATVPYGQPYSYQITVSSGAPLTSYSATSLPAGLSVNTSTGIISGTPAAPGTFTINLFASNSGGQSTNGATLVLTVNTPIPFSAIVNPVGLAFSPGGVLNCVNFNGFSGASNAGDVVKILSNGSTLLSPPFVYNLQNPGYPAFDSAGNLYVSETGTGNIYKVTPAGVSTVFASGFNDPIGLAFDASGNLYVAESQGGDVKKVTPGGSISQFATGFSVPTGLTFDSSGNLYVTNYSAGTVSEVTPAGAVSQYASGLSSPWQLAFDSSGNLYVANDAIAGTIGEIAPGGGTATTFASGLTTPTGLAFDSIGDLFISEFNLNQVIEIQAKPGTYTVPPTPVVNPGVGTDVYGSTYGGYTITVSSGTPTSYNATGLPAGLTVDAVAGVISGTPTAGIGTYNVTISATNSVGGTGTATFTFTITPASLTITANGQAIPYTGTAYSGGNGVTVAGLVNGDTNSSLSGTLSYSGSAEGAVNVGSYAIVPGGLSDPNYSISYANGTLQINAATGTVMVPNVTVTYSDSPVSVTANSSVPGLGLSYTYNGSSTPPTNVGSYTVVATASGSTNYSITYTSGTLTILPAPLTITASNASKPYDGNAYSGGNGVTYSAFQGSDSAASLAGALAYTGTSQGATNVGTYAITPGGLSDPNYAITYANGTLTISTAAVTVTAPSTSVQYNGSAVVLPAATVTPSVTGLTITYTYSGSPTAPSNVGTYTVTPTATNSNYNITFVSGSVTITQAPLTITASNATVTYSGTGYTGGNGVTYAGLQGGDSASSFGGALAYTGTSQGAVNVGTYAITPGGLADSNYAITYASGTLTISAAAVTVTAPSTSVPYNGSPVVLPAATVTPSVTGLTVTYTYSGSPTAPSNVGTYTVTPVATNSNYNITFVPGSVTITPVALTVTAANASKTYDGAAYTGGNGVTYAGFQGSDSAASLGGSLAYTGTSQGAINAGTYAITPGGLTDSNYSIGYANGTLTINAAAVTVTAPSTSVQYNGSAVALPAATVSPSVAGLTVTYSYSGSPTAPSNAGTYTVTPAATNPNYTFTFVSGTVTITAAPLTVTAANASKTYDGTGYTGGNGVTYAGLQGSDSAASFGGTLAYTGTSQGAINAGTYAITPGGLTDSNYSISYANGTLTINTAAVTVTAPSASIPYNGSAVVLPAATVTPSVAGLTVTYTYSGSPTAPANVGTYTVIPAATNSNYTITFVSGSVNITPAALTVTASNFSKTYDGNAYSGGNGVTYAGLQGADSAASFGGTLAYTGTSQGATNAGAYVITPGGLTDSNYSISYANGALTISAAAVTVTAPSASIPYSGSAVVLPAATVTPSVTGLTVTYTYSGSPTAPTSVGSYTVTPSATNPNYNFTFVPGSVTITPAPLTITANNATTTYSGTAYTGGNGVKYLGLQGTDSASSFGGALAYTGTSQGAINAGTYAITPGGLTDSNYSISYANGTLTISAAAITVTAPSASVPYSGAAVVLPAATVTPATTGLTITYTYSGSPTAPANVGSYTVTPAATNSNYTITFVSGTVTITSVPLTITASNASKTYDGNAYSGGNGVTYAGLQGTDTASSFGGALAYTGTSQGATNAGTYVITPGGLTDPNYSISYANGTLTVNAAAVTVTAPSTSIQYNGAAVVLPAATVTPTTTGLTVTYTYSGSPTAPSNVGSYAVNPTATNPNYNFTFVPGTVTITTAPLTITANNATATYSGTAYTGGNGVKYTGLQGTDSASSFGGALAYTGTSQGATNAGTYVITPGGLTDSNYSISYVNGALTISAAAVTVTAPSTSVPYNGSAVVLPAATVTPTTTGLTITYTYSGSPTAPANVGSYTVNPAATNPNYTFTFVPGTVTITPAPVTITATSTSKSYDGNAYSGGNGVTYAGLQGADSAASFGGTLAYMGTSQGATNAGAYVITPGGLTDSNYSITYANGALTINAAAVTVTAPSVSIPYSGAAVVLPAATVTPTTTGLTVTYTYAGSPTAPANVGSYAVTPTATNPNYTFTFVPGNVTITAVPLTITACNATTTYSGTAYTGGNGVKYTGLQGTDSASSFGGTLAYTGTSQGAINAGTYVITPGGLTDSNYAITYANGTLTVSAAAVTVTAPSTSIPYSGSVVVLPAATVTPTTTGLTITYTYSGSPTAPANVGSYTVTPVATNPNYTFTFVPGTVAITAAPLTITACNATTTYSGTAYTGGNGVKYTGLQGTDSAASFGGTLAYTGTSQGATNAGTYVITAGGLADPNYSISYVNGTLTINAAAVTVTAPSTSIPYSGSVVVLPAATVTPTTTGLTITYTYSGSPTAPANVGSYAVTPTATNPNYNFTFVAGNVTITPAPLTITACNATTTYSGTAYTGGNGVKYTGLQGTDGAASFGGTLAYTGTSQGAINAATYVITPGGLSDSNYAITYANGTLTINPEAVTIAGPSASIPYTGSVVVLPTATMTPSSVTGLTVTYTYSSPSAPSSVGTYTVTPAATGSNYTFTFTPGTITITPAPLTVTACNATTTYSGTAYTGGNGVKAMTLLGSDTLASLGTPTYTGSSQSAVNAGTYVITPGGLSNPNYAITYANGTLTINPEAVTIAGPSASIPYTGSAVVLPAATVTPSTVTGLTITYSYSGSPTAPANVGSYTVTPAATGSNYAFTFTPGTVTITPAPLTVTACAATTTYSGTAYTGGNGVKYTGLQGTDGAASFGGTLAYTGTSQGAINAATYVITPGGLSDSNYAITYANGTLTINPEAVTIAGPSASIPYTGSVVVLPASTVTPSSVTGLTVTYTYSGSPSAPANVGTYTVTPVATGSNYAFTFTPGTIKITPAPLTVTACAATTTYSGTAYTGGNGIKAATLLGSDTPASLGTPTYTGTSQGAINAGSYVITPGGLSNPNYAITYVNGTLTINPEAVTITGPSASIPYTGAAVVLPASTVSPSGITGLTITYTYSSPSAPVNVGTYTVTPAATGSNYAFTFTPGTIKITPAPLTVTACAATTTYSGTAYTGGNGIKAATLLGSDTLASLGTPTYTGTSQGAINAGSYVITPGGLSDSNYAITYANGTLTINPEPVTITVPGTSVQYTGSAVVVPAATVTPTVTGLTITYTYSSTTAPVNVGTYTVTPVTTGSNYAFTFTSGTVKITPAPLTVTACPATTIYSGTAYKGGNGIKAATLLGSDTLASLGTPTFTGTSQGAINAGNYVITASGLSDLNYAITYVNGTLTIGPATATITVPSTTVTYTGKPAVVTPATVSPSVSGLTITYTYNGSSTIPTAAGTYTVSALASNSNYTFTVTTGTLTISKAALTITASNATKTYTGTANSGGNGVTYSGLVGSDTSASLSGALAYAGTSQGAINAGTYVITPAGLSDLNYSITFANGTLTIAAAKVTIMVPNTTLVYTGSAAIMPAATVSPAVTGLAITYSYAGSATAPTNVGSYTVTPAATSANYTFTFVPGTLTITKAVLTVSANSQSITAGQAIPTLTYMITGYLGGDTVGTALTGTPKVTTTATTNSAAGTYPITAAQGTLASANYSFSFVAGTLTVASNAECLVWLQGHCGNQTNCNGGRGYNGCGGYGDLNSYCGSGGYSSSSCNQTVTGGCVVPIAFALYNCSNGNYRSGSSFGTGCSGGFVVDTTTVISVSELGSDGNLSDPVVYGYSATGPNPPNFWIINNEYLLNFPTAAGTHSYVVDVYHPEANGSLQLLGSENLYTNSNCLGNTCSTTSSFNGATIAKGDTIWFSSIVSLNCPSTQATTLVYDSSTVSFNANGRQVTINVPAATIKVDPTATTATTTYSALTNSWVTIVPAGYTGNVFLSGAGYPVTSTISGGVSSVTWSGLFRSDCSSISAQWNWSAAVYTQFNTDANQLGVKPVASSTLSQYLNTDLAGTPENYKKYITTGACGTGGTSYTGTYRSSSSASFGSGCWSDSCSFASGWGYGWGNGWGYSCSNSSGGTWGNGGSGGNNCGNGGDGACDGNWGYGWTSSGSCSW